jgi:DnaJ-class molecular chaperone
MKHLKIFEEFDDINIKDMMKRGYHSADVKKKKNSDEECENCNGTGIDEDNDTCGLCGGTGTKSD